MNALVNGIELTKDDTLKNILIMAPLLDEAGQNRVFGLMCGLICSRNDSCRDPEDEVPEAAAG